MDASAVSFEGTEVKEHEDGLRDESSSIMVEIPSSIVHAEDLYR